MRIDLRESILDDVQEEYVGTIPVALQQHLDMEAVHGWPTLPITASRGTSNLANSAA